MQGMVEMWHIFEKSGEGGAMLAACLLIPNDPSSTSMGYTITKFLPGFFSSFSYTPRKTMQICVTFPPYLAYLKL